MFGALGPFNRFDAVTTSDTVDLPNGVTDGIYIGGAGNVRVIMANGDAATITGALVGHVLPFRVKRINATLTTATNLVALYRK